MPPTQEEKDNGLKKVVDGKTYYWCSNHQAWTRHKESECKGVGLKKEARCKVLPFHGAGEYDKFRQFKHT